ncbi:hypothetical protein Tco_0651198 [Tanacetum coccineum]
MMPSLERSRQCRFMLATSSPRFVSDAIPDIMNKSATSLDRFADAISSPLLALKISKSNKNSIQINDHPIEIVLNEPTLGMILFIDPDKQDFIIINDFDDLKDETQYESKCADDGY